MKYSIIASIFVFLFLNACNPDINTNQKNIKHQLSKKRKKYNKKKLTPKAEVKPNQEEDHNKKIKNTPLDDLINLIKKANAEREEYVKRFDEEPENQYGMSIFKELGWWGKDGSSKGENIAANTERSKNYRKKIYSALSDIDTNQLKKVSEIVMLSKQTQGLFNTLSAFGNTLDQVIIDLYSKKDYLNKLEISNIEKLKNSFEKILSIKKDVSGELNQLLLDYENDTNNIKTNAAELKSYVIKLHNQILEKKEKENELKNEIFSLIENL
ncbi:virulence associated lipoprotein [Borreliella lusitaniae]|uniref:virulence associated lipoprotein n=1 Tax=Borreliella lusitaniae TaxID=100177 RepID=UPI002648EAFF|nr:virulence associated lipoprotein [Borreliella lusitaniae]WKC84883.1 virulence associated lipoprotein [Borreliella lusitaniae]